MEREILLLGDERLYAVAETVKKEEIPALKGVFGDMFDTIRKIQRTLGFGRAIAAPQIGVGKRIICMLLDKPYVVINPSLEFVGDEKFTLWDDCMSFPNLLVRVERYRHTILRYTDESGNECVKRMDDSLSELIQHEYDHLDGVLATMRAVDDRSLKMKAAEK